MTATAQPEPATPTRATCWCCGGLFPGSGLVRHGEHPEVGLCLDCAMWIR